MLTTHKLMSETQKISVFKHYRSRSKSVEMFRVVPAKGKKDFSPQFVWGLIHWDFALDA